MQNSPIKVAALGLGLLSRLVAGVPVCQDPNDALVMINFGVAPASSCVAGLMSQASSFCQSYQSLSPYTAYLSTSTTAPLPVTDSETSTTSTTTTVEVITTLPTTSYSTETTTQTSVTEMPIRRKRELIPSALPCNNCLNPSTDCINLSPPNLMRRPSASLEVICDCIGIPIPTVTISDLTTSVPTSTVTVMSVETDVVSYTGSTETVFSTTTFTETDTATTTTTSTTPTP